MFHLSTIPLEQLNLREGLHTSEAGGFCSFEGWVRDHNEGRRVTAMEYEADPALCEKEAAKIFQEAKAKFNIIKLKAFHRTGKLKAGEMAVWIGVGASHRDAAFAACRYVIDEIKHRLPIWKKEYSDNGESKWVGCESCSSHKTQGQSEYQFYSRQMILPEIGAQGQKKLKAAKVLVVGAGGLGSSALISLAGTGIGTIGICDHDVLRENNLHRQFLYAHKDIGRSKAQLARERLEALNPYITFNIHQEKLEPVNVEKIIKEYDVLLDCTDNFATKFLLNDACFLFKKPFVQASVYQWEGQIQVLNPAKPGCLRCLWPRIPQSNCVGTCADVGVIGLVPSILGHYQALEAIKYILNTSVSIENEIIILNLKNYEIQKIKKEINPSCPLCGPRASISTINQENYIPPVLFTIKLSDLNDSEKKKFEFIDIREADERLTEPVESIKSQHFPLSRLAHTSFDFEPNKSYVFFCAKGKRSSLLVEQLREQGIINVYSLANGIGAFKNKD